VRAWFETLIECFELALIFGMAVALVAGIAGLFWIVIAVAVHHL
jgi:hypothetical protein